jgi:hypothetical protein
MLVSELLPTYNINRQNDVPPHTHFSAGLQVWVG